MMEYYFRGVASWDWYYPAHYAPFASDMKNQCDIDITFEKDKPKTPFFQLMAVMPLGSSEFLPEGLRKLMHSQEFAPFYPHVFKIDQNHKRFDWEGVVNIPFLVSGKLDEALLSNLDPELTEVEKARNLNKEPLIIAHEKVLPTEEIEREQEFAGLLPGTVEKPTDSNPKNTKLICSNDLPDSYDPVNDLSKVATYKLPDYHPDHLCKLLPGVIDESPELNKEKDYLESKPHLSHNLMRVKDQLCGRKRKGAPTESNDSATEPPVEVVELSPRKKEKQRMKKWVLSNNPFAALADFY